VGLEMNGRHFIFDFETLGTDLLKGFPVLECSYAIFDADRFLSDPYSFDELVGSVIKRDKLNIEHQVKEFGYKIDQDTLTWWKSQDPKVMEKILKPTPQDLHTEEFVSNILTYLNKNPDVKYWWARSGTFDPMIMWRMCTDVQKITEFNYRMKHWLLRDTRTFIDAKLNFAPDMNSFVLKEWEEKFEKHNSIHDVAVDILRLQKLIMMENEDD
jgi:hypothetical protein